MKRFLALTTLVFTLNVEAKLDVVYGRDNRQDVYQSTNALHKKLAASTAGMIKISDLQKSSNGTYDLLNTKTLEEAMNLCPSEAFSDQPIAPRCSGFLVGPDTLVTAGHCYRGQEPTEFACSNYAWVFDYDMKSESSDPTKSISASNVYKCKQVISSALTSSYDFAIVKLDRAVTGRAPLKFRTSGRITTSSSLVVIGHPTGLPTKIADGGKVTRNFENTTFSTNLDTFHGNSGSAVFDARNGIIEGILIQGKNDYMRGSHNSKSCIVVNKCDENGNSCTAGDDPGPVKWGEVVLRIESIAKELSAALKAK